MGLSVGFASGGAVMGVVGRVRRGVAVGLAVWMGVAVGMARSATAAEEITIVALGDSLTAGYLLPPTASLPAQLERALRAKGFAVRVLNAGVSGDTTSAGRARLDWALDPETDAVIVALGANDALRGIPVEEAKANLQAILAELKARGLPALLAGMEAPRNLGDAYAEAFTKMYVDLAEDFSPVYYPFLLDGVALDPKLNLPDGIHPTEQGVAVIVQRILPSVEALLARIPPAVPRG